MATGGVNPTTGLTGDAAAAAARANPGTAAANQAAGTGGLAAFTLNQTTGAQPQAATAAAAPADPNAQWHAPATSLLSEFLGLSSGGAPVGVPVSSTGTQPPAPIGTTNSTNSSAVAGGPTTAGTAATVLAATPTAGTNAGAVDAGGPRGTRNVGTSLRGMNRPINAVVGEASFSLPPVATSNRSVKAPAVTWGKGWVRDGDHMVHTNGTLAYVRKQPRVSIGNPAKAQSVETPYGHGRKLADGTVVGVDSQGKPFALDAKGSKRTLAFGDYTIGGQKVHVFQATTVNVLTPDKRFMRYDSRGNVHMGRSGSLHALGGGPTAQPAIAAATAASSAANGGASVTQTGTPTQTGNPTQSPVQTPTQTGVAGGGSVAQTGAAAGGAAGAGSTTTGASATTAASATGAAAGGATGAAAGGATTAQTSAALGGLVAQIPALHNPQAVQQLIDMLRMLLGQLQSGGDGAMKMADGQTCDMNALQMSGMPGGVSQALGGSSTVTVAPKAVLRSDADPKVYAFDAARVQAGLPVPTSAALTAANARLVDPKVLVDPAAYAQATVDQFGALNAWLATQDSATQAGYTTLRAKFGFVPA